MGHAVKGVFDRMRAFRFGALAGPAASLLLATACQTATAPPTPAAPAAQGVAVGSTLGTTPAIPAGWKRPDVAPAAEQGKFKVISQSPQAGDRVRVFFLGAQF